MFASDIERLYRLPSYTCQDTAASRERTRGFQTLRCPLHAAVAPLGPGDSRLRAGLRRGHGRAGPPARAAGRQGAHRSHLINGAPFASLLRRVPVAGPQCVSVDVVRNVTASFFGVSMAVLSVRTLAILAYGTSYDCVWLQC